MDQALWTFRPIHKSAQSYKIKVFITYSTCLLNDRINSLLRGIIHVDTRNILYIMLDIQIKFVIHGTKNFFKKRKKFENKSRPKVTQVLGLENIVL